MLKPAGEASAVEDGGGPGGGSAAAARDVAKAEAADAAKAAAAGECGGGDRRRVAVGIRATRAIRLAMGRWAGGGHLRCWSRERRRSGEGVKEACGAGAEVGLGRNWKFERERPAHAGQR